MPFPTRMTIVRLSSGELWVHSPIEIRDGLDEAISAIGSVRYLIAPNWIHYAWVPSWQQRFPNALTLASPGVVARAISKGIPLHINGQLVNEPPAYWAKDIDQRIAASGMHQEAVFFHRPTRTLILTDLIENFECSKMPWWTRPLLRLGGVCAPHGGMPRDMAMSFRRHREHFSQLVSEMISWHPERVIIAHGKWFETNGTSELKRAFLRAGNLP